VAEDRFEELLGSYLLGELSAKEERELERHLGECAECRRELERLHQSHNVLRQLAANEPPAQLKDQVLARVREEAPARSIGGWWFWASAAAALLLVAVLGIGLFRGITGDPSAAVPLASTELAPKAGGEARIHMVGENVQVELEVWSMPELEEDEYYEMWYYAEDGRRISCGTFRAGPEGRTTVNLTAPAGAREYPEIEITRELDDGNPEASGEEVLEGDLRSTQARSLRLFHAWSALAG
jgi:anti-sigma-K factor RskA